MRLIMVVLLAWLPLFAQIVYAADVVDDANFKSAKSKPYIISSKMGRISPDTIPAKAAPFLESQKYLVRTIRWPRYRRPICRGPITVTAYPGSLRNNIQHIAGRCGWETVWNPPCDYRWYGITRISGMNLSDVFRKMLKNYPVQAVFYQGNRVLAVGPRNLPPRYLP
ncbi:MAG: hypothetical protein WBE18_04950 [Gammaproteobacteria bacterium]